MRSKYIYQVDVDLVSVNHWYVTRMDYDESRGSKVAGGGGVSQKRCFGVEWVFLVFFSFFTGEWQLSD